MPHSLVCHLHSIHLQQEQRIVVVTSSVLNQGTEGLSDRAENTEEACVRAGHQAYLAQIVA